VGAISATQLQAVGIVHVELPAPGVEGRELGLGVVDFQTAERVRERARDRKPSARSSALRTALASSMRRPAAARLSTRRYHAAYASLGAPSDIEILHLSTA
jgi:hypothetical protein